MIEFGEISVSVSAEVAVFDIKAYAALETERD